MEKGKNRQTTAELEALIESYFADCEENSAHPSMTGLALALGFDTRRELEEKLREKGKRGSLLRRAQSRVEEATIQSAYKKESSMSARFFLQESFGYGDKSKATEPAESEINVSLTDGE